MNGGMVIGTASIRQAISRQHGAGTRVMLTALAALVGCTQSKAPSVAGRAEGGLRELRPATVVTSDSAMVVSASPYATEAGLAALRNGGNAVDAAVAVAFTLAVTYPTAGNIGGGGFLVARINGQNVALDFREMAPGAASRNMYLDSSGTLTDKSLTGALAAGVPGSVAGLFEAHRKYGAKPWSELVQPAIDLAEQGFVVDTAFSEDSEGASERLAKDSASAALFFRNGRFVAPGTTWRAPELAAVLRRIAQRGRDGFYTGETADLIVAAMQKSGGIMTRADLAGYTPLWRTPVEFEYRGHRVVSMPPASSGGLTLALILGIVGSADVASLGWRSGASIHLLAEAERRAFARRNALLGDPAFGPIATAAFLSKDTAAALRAQITERASAGSNGPAAAEPRHTTHFSIVDAKGNAVVADHHAEREFRRGVHGAGRAVSVE